jgi:hypothetical protein
MPAVIVGNLNPDTVEVVANPLAVPPKVKPDNEKIRQYQRCNLTLARLPGASEYHDGQVLPCHKKLGIFKFMFSLSDTFFIVHVLDSNFVGQS